MQLPNLLSCLLQVISGCSKWHLSHAVLALVLYYRRAIYLRHKLLIDRAETSQLKMALTVLESGAQRLDSLQNCAPPVDQIRLDSTAAEYYMLRVHLVGFTTKFKVDEHS